MEALMTRSSPRRLAFLIALLCVVSLRLLTPPGWMPNFEGAASAPLVICTGDGSHARREADSGSHAPAGKDAHDVCAFADFSLDAAPPPTTPPPEPVAFAYSEAEPLPADQARPTPVWRRPQAARAPPRLA
jgi:hypothetical protein